MTKRHDAQRYLREVVLTFYGDECLIWPFAKFTNGYGHIADTNGDYLVHRMVCEIVNGPPPDPSYLARHLCGKGREGCCNPKHLAWGTSSQNQADKLAHGTMPVGDRSHLAKLTEADALEIIGLRGTVPQHVLANRFGVQQSAISRIQSGKRWAHLKGSEAAA